MGELNYGNTTDDAHPQQFMIIERFKHPNFRHPSKYNDIALLRVDNTVHFDQYIRPACLQQSQSLDAEKVIASGWGKTDYNKPSSEHMQKVLLELFTHTECNASYANEIGRRLRVGIAEETQICAGSHSSKKDTCQVCIVNSSTAFFENSISFCFIFFCFIGRFGWANTNIS